MHRNLLASLLAAVAVAALSSPASAQSQPPGEVVLTLPAQHLARSLREVSVRTGRSIVAPSELVKGRMAPAVSGPFTAESAVRMLLAGSGLDVRPVGDSLVIFQSGTAEPQRPSTDGAGQEPDPNPVIVVTGTHLRGVPPTSPTIVLSRDYIERSGASSVEQLMRTVPQNFQGGVNQENFEVVGTGADPTEHGAGINLRGLGQRATLVLINGHRLAPSGDGSFADVSLIPLSAIDRVEIVTDGASAIYGSDAVGGVVNFLLRDRFDGVESFLRGSTTTEGGGNEVVAGVTAGHSWAGGHLLLSYEYHDSRPILSRERQFTINLPAETDLLPQERRHSLFAAFSEQLTDRLRVDIQGLWSHRNTRRTYFFSTTPLPVGATASATGGNLSASSSYRIGGDWIIEAGSLYALDQTAEIQRQPGASIELQNLFNTRNELLEHDVKVDGTLLPLPAGGVKLALGASLRTENYDDEFATGIAASAPKNQSRQVRSLYGEISVPLFSSANRLPILERLVVDGAVRYENYDAFGSTVNPRVGALWSPSGGITFRGSYDTSFRAPLLSEMGGVYNAFYFPGSIVSVTPVPAGTVALVVSGSNPAIKPERSRTWTVGGDLEPAFAPGLKLSANYYSIRFSNRIALPAPTVVVVGNPAFDPIVTRNPSADLVSRLLAGAALLRDFTGPGFTNGGATASEVSLIVDLRFNNTAVTTTRGLDFSLHYPFELGKSRFVADANVNYILSFEDQLTATAPPINGVNRPYRPVALRLRGSLEWTRGPWSANATINYTDSYSDDRSSVIRPVGAFTTVDAGIAFEPESAAGLAKGLRIALNAQNLLAERPPLLVPDPGSTRGYGYDPVNATGRGRVVEIEIRKKW